MVSVIGVPNMQILDKNLLAYVKHRLGQERIRSWLPRYNRRALELNAPSLDLDAKFGDAAMKAYVGFLDLAGFSTRVQGMTPHQIADYLEPFLSRVVTILRGHDALIDKTIGDEVMFVIPDLEEEAGFALLCLGQLLGALHDLAFELNGTYPFRIGLSWGNVRFFCIRGKGYEEWTTVGEPVHVAKRLHELEEMRTPTPVCGAFGMSVTDDAMAVVQAVMRRNLAFIAGVASRFDCRLSAQPRSLKGVGSTLFAVLLPRPERVER
jgi:class 3 adenylate cyclase